MSRSTKAHITEQHEQLIAAINRGVGDIRGLQEAAGYSSTSVVKSQLKILEEKGEVVLLRHGNQEKVYTGREFARAWDMACKASGNPDA